MSLHAEITHRLGTLDLQVELDVQPGEVVALLGPNGSGKTTLLRCLAGLCPIDAGRIELNGVALDEPSSGTLRAPETREIGFVFQDYTLFRQMTVLENVAFGLRARGMRAAEARRMATAWIDRVGLMDYARQRPPALSGGQAQRVALARALVTSPSMLLLDEPLAALDAGTRATVRRDLRRHLATFDGVALLVTHDPVDAYALADRVAILDAGRIVQTGTLADVTAHPRSRYVADLVGVNLVAGDVLEGVLTTPAGVRVIVADAPAGPAFAVIRPHSIALNRDVDAHSSVRNSWVGTIAEVDRLGDRARVGIVGTLALTAEITTAALDALHLQLGDEINATVKATDIDVYPA
ncbi:MAG: ABC transporter ATP-binding protein [Actinomycetia bacterium]|nr:ABC transporter ATP-binding protein [Actinomycetes bacterium]